MWVHNFSECLFGRRHLNESSARRFVTKPGVVKHHRKPKSRAEDGCDIFEVNVTLRVIMSKHDSFQNISGTVDLFATKLAKWYIIITSYRVM